MDEYGTPRRLVTIGGSTLSVHSPLLASLYKYPPLINFLQAIACERLYLCHHPQEFMMINYLLEPGDTHGWHVDDPAYALVVVPDAPAAGPGGLLELIAQWAEIRGELDASSTQNTVSLIE